MNLSHFDLNLLKALDALLEERNVTNAAKRLFVTQQAASGALNRLREHFDDQLLVRVGRHFELTPVAQSLVAPVREALLTVRAAIGTRPTFDPKQSQANFRIAMSDYALLVLLPSLLRLLTAEAPKINCVIESIGPRSVEALEMGDLDFCLMAYAGPLFATPPSARIRSAAMFDDDFVCVVDPRHIDVTRGISLGEYRQLRHNTAAFGKGMGTLVERAWLKSNRSYDVGVTAPSFSALVFMLPGTPLVATVQRRLANTLAPRLGLAVTECPLKIPRLREVLLWHVRSEADPAHGFLRKSIESAAETLDVRTELSYKQKL